MPSLFKIPSDVALAILMDWLGDAKSLVALDSASARSVRRAYLGLVRDAAFILMEEQSFNWKTRAKEDICHWFNSRGVKIRAINAECEAEAMEVAAQICPECLVTVNALTLSCNDYQEIDSKTFSALMERLPSVTYLDMGRVCTNDIRHLEVLANLPHHLHLHTLKLSDINNSNSNNFNDVVRTFASALVVLELGIWQEETLCLVGSMCNNLEQLRITCYDLSPEAIILALGPGKLPLLKAVDFVQASCVNDDVVLAVCASHLNLESISAMPSFEITLASIGIALSHCPRFQNLLTSHFDFTTVFPTGDGAHASSLPFYDLNVWGHIATIDWRNVFQSIICAQFYNHRVRSLHCSRIHKFTSDEIESILDAFGKDLRALAIALSDAVHHEILDRLLQECTELRTLFLMNSVVLTDDLIVQLADHCHHITSLSLAGAANITDEIICYLLQCMGHQLVFLYLEHCSLLNEPTLTAIVDHCAKLEGLNIIGTGITADTIITHVVKPDRLLKLTSLQSDPGTREDLSDFVRRKENGANERWQWL